MELIFVMIIAQLIFFMKRDGSSHYRAMILLAATICIILNQLYLQNDIRVKTIFEALTIFMFIPILMIGRTLRDKINE